jgi:hypothetical protein
MPHILWLEHLRVNGAIGLKEFETSAFPRDAVVLYTLDLSLVRAPNSRDDTYF